MDDHQHLKLPKMSPEQECFELFYNCTSLVISVMYLIFYEKYHEDYNFHRNHDADLNCPYMFPTWMYVTGIVCVSASGIGFVLSVMALTTLMLGEESSIGKCLQVWVMLIGVIFACAIIPLIFFLAGWGIYGLDLLWRTDAACQETMYYLGLYSYIWALFSTCVVLCCFKPVREHDDQDDEEAQAPLIPTSPSPSPQQQQSPTTVDRNPPPDKAPTPTATEATHIDISGID